MTNTAIDSADLPESRIVPVFNREGKPIGKLDARKTECVLSVGSSREELNALSAGWWTELNRLRGRDGQPDQFFLCERSWWEAEDGDETREKFVLIDKDEALEWLRENAAEDAVWLPPDLLADLGLTIIDFTPDEVTVDRIPRQGGDDPGKMPTAAVPSKETKPVEETSPAKVKNSIPSKNRQDDIITAIREANTPLKRSEIQAKLRLKRPGALGRHLAYMAREKKLTKISGEGYWPTSDPLPE